MDAREKYRSLFNPILYWKIVGPGFHRELLGFSRPCNMFELIHLVGSEACSDNFQKVELDDLYISYLPLKRLRITKPMQVTEFMNTKYPWFKLAESIKEEGFKCALIVEVTNNHGFVVVEGKHRFGAASLVVPFNPSLKLPCLIVSRDELYTAKMFKQPHPHPLTPAGTKSFTRK